VPKGIPRDVKHTVQMWTEWISRLLLYSNPGTGADLLRLIAQLDVVSQQAAPAAVSGCHELGRTLTKEGHVVADLAHDGTENKPTGIVIPGNEAGVRIAPSSQRLPEWR
jgi:DUF917 family protein